jgi:FkbM family methyltransferase
MTPRRFLKKFLYGHCPGLAGSFPYYGTTVFFPRHSVIFHRACSEGIFEADLVRLIQRLVRPETTYWDVGANIGLMSLPVLAGCPAVNVISIEPSPLNLPFLRQTAAASGFGSRWQIIPRAACQHSGPGCFFTSDCCGGALDGLKNTGRGRNPLEVRVECTTLDQEWVHQGQPHISCIKIDVEGAELDVLRGAEHCLARERPAVLLEWNEINLAAYQRDPAELVSYAAARGFDLLSCRPLSLITSAPMLRLIMSTCENFLLLPRY